MRARIDSSDFDDRSSVPSVPSSRCTSSSTRLTVRSSSGPVVTFSMPSAERFRLAVSARSSPRCSLRIACRLSSDCRALGGAALEVLHRLVREQVLDLDRHLVRLAGERVHLVEEADAARAGDPVAPADRLGRGAGDDVGHHAPQEAARLHLDPRVLRDRVLALDLEADVDVLLPDARSR